MTTADAPDRAAPITGLSHVQLVVADVAASGRWYGAVLGLTPFAEDPAIGYLALRHRGAKIVVVLSAGPEQGAAEPARQLVDHLAFAVPDGGSLAAWADHLTEIGIAHDGIALEGGHPTLQLRDPDGMAIELVAP
jgi:glyoxylase I family protein